MILLHIYDDEQNNSTLTDLNHILYLPLNQSRYVQRDKLLAHENHSMTLQANDEIVEFE